MTQVDVGPAARLYGMMQHLLTVAAHHELPEAAPERGVVMRDDALDAILQVAAVIDEATAKGSRKRWHGRQGHAGSRRTGCTSPASRGNRRDSGIDRLPRQQTVGSRSGYRR